jgi:hypothetical protein
MKTKANDVCDAEENSKHRLCLNEDENQGARQGRSDQGRSDPGESRKNHTTRGRRWAYLDENLLPGVDNHHDASRVPRPPVRKLVTLCVGGAFIHDRLALPTAGAMG